MDLKGFTEDFYHRICGGHLAPVLDTLRYLKHETFHPDFHMLDKSATSMTSLLQAKKIAKANGLHYVYLGNVHDVADGSTWCPSCGKLLIERDGYRLGRWALKDGSCQYCNTRIAGIFEAMPGNWGPKRWPIEIK